jgi:hypothetical protein
MYQTRAVIVAIEHKQLNIYFCIVRSLMILVVSFSVA